MVIKQHKPENNVRKFRQNCVLECTLFSSTRMFGQVKRCVNNAVSRKTKGKPVKPLIFSLAMAVAIAAKPSFAQSISLEELDALVTKRAQTLGGYEDFLMDPDPKRAMAALQIMLESGDETLVSMALKHGLTSPNPDLRWAALKSYISGKPTLGLRVDASAASDDENKLSLLDIILKNHGGSLGSNKTGSIVIALGAENAELGCISRRVQTEICAARLNATSVSLYLASFDKDVEPGWFDLTLNESGQLTGSFTVAYTRSPRQYRVPLDISINLIE